MATQFIPQFTPQLITPALKSHIEMLLTFYVDVAQRALETLQGLNELNMQLGRDLMAEAGAGGQRLMACRDAGQLGAALGAQVNANGAALANYQRRLADVLSRGNASISQTAATHMPAVSRSATVLAADLVQRASDETARATEKLSQYQPSSPMRH